MWQHELQPRRSKQGVWRAAAAADAEHRDWNKMVAAVDRACFADICMSDHHRRSCMSHAVLYSCHTSARRSSLLSLCYTFECDNVCDSSLETYSYDSYFAAERKNACAEATRPTLHVATSLQAHARIALRGGEMPDMGIDTHGHGRGLGRERGGTQRWARRLPSRRSSRARTERSSCYRRPIAGCGQVSVG